jgi:Ca-activated chloride channel family protein
MCDRDEKDDDMTDSNSPSQTTSEAVSRRRRALLVALLFATTLGGALGARLAADPGTGTRTGTGDPEELHRRIVQDALTFEGRLDRGAVQVGGEGLVHLELIVAGAALPERLPVRRPADVVVVLDRSGSMGGDPMANALGSIRELIEQLGSEDRLALVTYSNDAAVRWPLERAAATARTRWITGIASIAAGGGTNMSSGLDLAHELLASARQQDREARILLLSDGHANQGDASPDGLARRSARAVAGD